MLAKHLKTILIVIVTVLTLAIILLFSQYKDILKNATANTINMKQIYVEDIAKNIEQTLKRNFPSQIRNPFKIDKDCLSKINHTLSLFVGKQYTYVYAIAKKDNKYRYIFDGSKDPKDKGEYLQKFDPTIKDIWDKAWSEQKRVWRNQDTLDGLWVTYLYPVVIDNKTKFILAFDFSEKSYKLIQTTFSPMYKYLMYLSILLTFILILIYVISYFLYQQRQKAIIDPLTKLHNRHYLNIIEKNIDLKNYAIAMVDLDHFKKINDNYGHLTGDKILKSFASILNLYLRAGDIVFRYGGEEFLILLEKKESEYIKTEVIIQSLHQRISKEPIYIDDNPISLTASIGFNQTPHLNRSLNDAIEVADKMLYIAKTSGRNRVEIHYDNTQKNKNILGPREVMEIIKNDGLLAYFQPIADAKSGEIIKYEALARLIDKDNNLLLPISFLPNIKSKNAYRTLSKEILAKAFETIKNHNVSISINFDIGDFLDQTLFEQIYDIIKQEKNLASKLTIEILEDIQITDFTSITQRIEKLKELGITIAVDDFGTGYSTFSYLLSLKPDILKIDGFIIEKLENNEDSKAIVKSIVDLCKKLDIKITAEYVSSQKIKNIVQELDIDFLQGYAIGKAQKSIK